MATKDEIKATILKLDSNLEDIADELANAVWQLENKNSNNPAKEARVIDTKETR